MSRFWCRTCGAPAPNEPADLVAAVEHNPGPCPNCGTNGWETEITPAERARLDRAWREQFGRERESC